MERNTAEILVKVFAGIYWLVAVVALFGAVAFFTLGAAGGAGLLAGLTPEEAAAAGALSTIAPAIGVLFILLALAYVFVGFGLWMYKPWARITAIVLSVISLFSFPIGTLIGAVGIWLFGFEETVKSLFGAPAVATKVAAAPSKPARTKKLAKKKR